MANGKYSFVIIVANEKIRLNIAGKSKGLDRVNSDYVTNSSTVIIY